MKSSLFLVALATSVSASFFDRVVKRDAATIENDIANISTQVQSLTTAINNFQNINQALPLINAEMTLEAAINMGTADATATPPLSEGDAVTILNAVNALIPIIVTALNAATSKYATFQAAIVEGIVMTDLANLNRETDMFANALIAIAPADLVSAANSAKSCIDAAFAAAQQTPPVPASASCAAPSISIGPTSTTPPTSVPPTSVPPTSIFPTTSVPMNGTSTFPTTSVPMNGTSTFPTTSVPKNGTSTFPTTSVPKNGTSTFPTTSVPANTTRTFPTTSVPKNGTNSVPPTTSPPGGSGSTCPPGGSGLATTTVTTTSVSVSVTTSVSTSVSTVTITGGGGGTTTTTTCPSNSKCTKAPNLYEVMANVDNIMSNWVCTF